MHLKIISLSATIFSGEVEVISLPGESGSFQVLKNHMPLVSTLVKGQLTCKSKGKTRSWDVLSGIVSVDNNQVTVLATTS